MTSQVRAPNQAHMARQTTPTKVGDSRSITALPESKRAPFTGSAPFVQLKCACGSGSGAGECDSCNEKKRLQRKGVGSAGPAGVAPALPTGGQGLDAPLRGQMEGAFGHSFAGVRVHHDAAAHHAAQSLHAHAFTVGQDVYFARGQFAPESRQGLRLLAHELSHTVQQRGLSSSASPTALQADDGGFAIDPVDAPLEREADAAADRVLSGGRPQVSMGAAIGVARAAKMQAFVQREPQTDTVSTPKVDGKYTTITRTLEVQACKKVGENRKTPDSQIFYWDKNAQSIGFRYSICNGKTKFGTTGDLQYSQVVDAARNLLTTVQNNPAGGGAALQNAIDTTQITANGSAVLTVDGVLEASVSSDSAVGTQAQAFNVKGKLIIAPSGDIRFQIDGGVGLNNDALGSQKTYTLSGSLGNDNFKISLQYQQIDFSPAGGGGGTSSNKVTGTGDVKIAPGVGLTGSVSKSNDSGFTATGGFKFDIDPIAKPAAVNCTRLECPPPVATYKCRTVIEPHDKKEVTRKADTKIFRMLQVYDNVQPLEPQIYAGQVNEIVTLLNNESDVKSITGHASPEASVDYNEKLSRKRATATKAAIQSEMTKQNVSATLPDVIAGGELHGGSSAHAGEAKNSELTTELKAELAALPDDEARLNFLQIQGERRTNPEKRAETLADIQAFINDKPGKKSASGHEDLWEKIFPYMRRTDVALSVKEQSKMVPVPGDPGKMGNCDAEALKYAVEQMPKIDPSKLLPQE